MALTDYTSCDSIRSVLGVSAKELSDLAIDKPVYLTELIANLDGIDPGLRPAFSTAKAAASPSAEQNKLVLLVDAYASYVAALQLLPQMPMFAPQIIKSDKAEMQRVANAVQGMAKTLRTSQVVFHRRLQVAYGAVNPAYIVPDTKSRTLVSISSISDPVLG